VARNNDNEPSSKEATMFGETFGAIVVFTFTLFVVGVVLYAIVRPFTHVHYDASDGSRQRLWQHLP
jgi:hypothetical protein